MFNSLRWWVIVVPKKLYFVDYSYYWLERLLLFWLPYMFWGSHLIFSLLFPLEYLQTASTLYTFRRLLFMIMTSVNSGCCFCFTSILFPTVGIQQIFYMVYSNIAHNFSTFWTYFLVINFNSCLWKSLLFYLSLFLRLGKKGMEFS